MMMFLCALLSAWKNIIHRVTPKICVSLKTESLVVEIFAAIHPEEYMSRTPNIFIELILPICKNYIYTDIHNLKYEVDTQRDK